MPDLPRISGDEVIKVLEKLGFYKARQKGSHVVMRQGDRVRYSPTQRTCVGHSQERA